ncbi:hypothetical protein BJ138DRAFT_1112483 [Hygrophoropsis aurantiaca]|uniref:Uncharacterized protein n=1 Tax=Hygrophoropsis aurantiaca TaxID=72124 RepID=A0ACB8AGA3_9AGAM|nr:hypothetical protein BJ138DRAFT_1112483 [Hygrophoropsis aurantiaca]
MLPRQSILPSSRSSHIPSSHSTTNAASLTRLQEKKKEYEAVTALERATAMFLKRMEGLAEDCEVMADAGQIHGQVLEQWPNMFRILELFMANRNQDANGSDSPVTPEHNRDQDGELLVRIPLDELEAGS